MTDELLGSIAILGAGNVGQALARGLVSSGRVATGDITLTRRHADKLEELATTDALTGLHGHTLIVSIQRHVAAGMPDQHHIAVAA